MRQKIMARYCQNDYDSDEFDDFDDEHEHHKNKTKKYLRK
jgi:hypothetical protein